MNVANVWANVWQKVRTDGSKGAERAKGQKGKRYGKSRSKTAVKVAKVAKVARNKSAPRQNVATAQNNHAHNIDYLHTQYRAITYYLHT